MLPITSTAARWLVNIPASHRPSMPSNHRKNLLFRKNAFLDKHFAVCKQSQISIWKGSTLRAADGDQSSTRAKDTSDSGRPTESEVVDSVSVVSVSFDAAPGVSVPTGRAILCGVTVLWGMYGVLLRFIYSNPGAPLASVLTLVRKGNTSWTWYKHNPLPLTVNCFQHPSDTLVGHWLRL